MRMCTRVHVHLCCMHVCMHAFACVCTHVYASVWHTCVCAFACVCAHVCICVACMHAFACVCTHVCASVWHACVCACFCMCVGTVCGCECIQRDLRLTAKLTKGHSSTYSLSQYLSAKHILLIWLVLVAGFLGGAHLCLQRLKFQMSHLACMAFICVPRDLNSSPQAWQIH